MSNRIPQNFIDELLARTDIVELVARRVPLKRAGREYAACCPFHNEKTPSFTVSPAKQFYHCFGCGEHGTAITFLMQHDNLGFLEAVEELASLAGMQVPREAAAGGDGPGSALYDVTSAVMAWYRRHLEGSSDAKAYLARRGVDAQTAETFLLGYAPEAWDALLRQFGRSATEVGHLADAGLIIQRDEGGDQRRYDRFRGRLMFPIRDARGRVIGFGGRLLAGGDSKQPKYLNSPETPLFHKGRELYGLYEMRRAMRNIQRVLVVEGYMDVIALHQLGIPNAVATLGTSTTSDHLKRLFRIADEVVFCFDGDRAGRAAAWRALENALPEVREGRQLRFLFLPEGQDPDSLVRDEGREAFEERVDAAQPLSRFLIGQLSQGLALDTVDGRARLAELARARVAKVPEGVYRDLLVRELAEAVGLSPEMLARRLPGAEADLTGPAGGRGRAGPRPRGRAPAAQDTPVRRALRIVLHFPAAAAELGDVSDLATLDLPGASLLCEVVETARDNPDITTASLVERWRDDPVGRHLGRLAGQPMLLEDDSLQTSLDDVQGAAAADLAAWLAEIRREATRRRKDALEAKPLSALTAEEKRELQALQHEARRHGRAGARASGEAPTRPSRTTPADTPP